MRQHLHAGRICVTIALIVLAFCVIRGYQRSSGESERPGPSAQKIETTKALTWSRNVLKSWSRATDVGAPLGRGPTPEERQALLAIFRAVIEERVPAPEYIGRIHEITGDDAVPFLLPLILDPTVEEQYASNMLSVLLCAARCGGMNGLVGDLSDGVLNTFKGSRDERLRGPLREIAADKRLGPGRRGNALIGLTELGLDGIDIALMLDSMDPREFGGVQAVATSIARVQFAKGSAAGRAEPFLEELKERAKTIALSSPDAMARADAIELLTDMGVIVAGEKVMDGYMNEPSPEARRALLRSFVQEPQGGEIYVCRLVEIWECETDAVNRDFALQAVATSGPLESDLRTLDWLGARLGPPTAPMTSLSVLPIIVEAALNIREADAKARPILRKIIDGSQYDPQLRQEAKEFLNRLEQAWGK